MSAVEPAFRKELTKVFLLPLLSLFLLPAIGYLFLLHAIPQHDQAILSAIEQNIDKDARLSPAGKADAKSMFRANPPSSTCSSANPELEKYRSVVCPEYSTLWQFALAKKISLWTLIGGALTLLAVLALGRLAFMNRRAQYASFVIGWRLLVLASAVEVVVQGALAVWLSFWLTAFFFHVYFIKIIALVGIVVAMAVFYAVFCIFKRPPQDTGIDGEVIDSDSAPALWAHIRDLASKLETKAPDQIVVGIDTNFFVTEAPLKVANKKLDGRSLFVSLPLLRLLDRTEADAVLAHELAHLRGGDTASSAALGPKLVQYDYYCHMMREAGVTILVYYLLRMYRVIFEFALRRDSREREFVADRTAASLVSGQAIVQSLIKIAAYARYRAEIENKLFAQNEQHGTSLGIARYIESGLAPYAMSPQFVDAMKSAGIPHPFDSHPPLAERMSNVNHRVDAEDFGRIATSVPAASWVTDIRSADGIEQRLWAAYESMFTAAHERNLAYRYEPANDNERAIVLKYFPPIAFALRGGKQIVITFEGPILPEETIALSWDSVTNLKYVDGMGGDVLEIIHPEKGYIGHKSTKVKLPGISKQRAQLKAALGHYWQRHQLMRRLASGPSGG